MIREQNTFVETPELEGSMSYAMITIGSSIGHLAAAIYSAAAYGLRVLSAPLRAREATQVLAASPVRSRACS